MGRRAWVRSGVGGGVAAVTAAPLAQEPYPTRPVKIIVPFTPGTGIDILARTLGQKLGDDWKVGVVVENRPGASGNIGTEAVGQVGARWLHAADDGADDGRQPQPVRVDPVRSRRRISRRSRRSRSDSLALVVAPVGQREDGERARRAREGEPRQAQLCVARQRHAASPGDGALQVASRHRHRARSVQGDRRTR